MPKLLQISIEVNIGSVGRIAEQIGQVAMKYGWESYITYARDNLASSSQVIKIGTLFDVYVHGIKTRITDKHAFYSNNATKKLIEKIEKIKPDLIHLHHLHGYFINVNILFDYLKISDIPLVWTFHDCWSFTGHCSYFEFIGCNKWKNECNNCPQKKKYPASFLIDRSKKNYFQKKEIFNSVKKMIIVPVSYWLEKLVSESFFKKYPIRVIQNGIDVNDFTPSYKDFTDVKTKYKISSNFIILGVAGIWEKRKGLDEFIKLNNLLPYEYCIVLVGLNKKQIKKLPKGIIGIQRTENLNELAKLYSLADVFVNPTLEDTFPTTNLESLACGTPIVTYRTGGSVESVSEDTGFVVDKCDVKSLLNSINIIKRNGKDYYSDACRKRAVNLYDRENKFQEYINLYNHLLDT